MKLSSHFHSNGGKHLIYLDQLKIGQQAIIKSINLDDISALMAMGVIPGAEIKLLRIAPVGDPLEFEIKNYALSLRKETCKKVEVVLNE